MYVHPARMLSYLIAVHLHESPPPAAYSAVALPLAGDYYRPILKLAQHTHAHPQ